MDACGCAKNAPAAGEDTQKWHREEVLKMSKEAVEDLRENGMRFTLFPRKSGIMEESHPPVGPEIFSVKWRGRTRLIKMAEDAR